MSGSSKASPSRGPQVVSFTNNRRTNSTTSASTLLATPTQRSWPVAFSDNTVPAPAQPQVVQRPHLVPVEAPVKKARKAPLLVRTNRALQAVLIALCGTAICAYGLDVVVSNDVGRLQEQARRLSEQNSEISANLLKSISYGKIQDRVVGRFALRVPEHVVIVKEATPPPALAYKMHKDHLPLMSGY